MQCAPPAAPVSHPRKAARPWLRLSGWCVVVVGMLTPAAAAEAPLGLRWELVANRPPAGGEGDFEALFILVNRGDAPLGDDDWELRFNMAPREIRPHPRPQPARVEHLNGDWYRLRPEPGFRLEPGGIVEVRYAGVEAVIKECDAPLGPYLVLRDPGGPEPRIVPVGDYRILPFVRAEQTSRGPRDGHPLPTPRERYEAAATISVLPEREIPPILPAPRSWRWGEGEVEVSAAWPIECPEPLVPTAEFLADGLASHFGGRPEVRTVASDRAVARGPAIRLAVANPAGAEGESYRLVVAGDGITITGGGEAGVFYGVQSLLQLFPWESLRRPEERIALPLITVDDAPRFAHRGLHVDVSRNFQTRETIERIIDLMAAYKLNRLLLYTTEDEGWRIEIPGLPELTEVGARREHAEGPEAPVVHPAYGSGPFADEPTSYGSGFYSRDDFIGILRHAARRHVKVIPELNFPAHARAAIKAMEARHRRLVAAGRPDEAEEYRLIDPDDHSVYLSAQGYRDNVVSVARESTYRFYEKVMDELAKMYAEAGLTMDEIHTGGDEVPTGAWADSPLAQKLLEREPGIGGVGNLQSHFFGRLSGILRSRGLHIHGWEEVALRRESADPGAALVPDPRFVADDVVIYVWNNLFDRDLGNRLANAGYRLVLCNVSNFYFDLAYEKDPREPGLYWAGFVDARDAYAFAPYDYALTTLRTALGEPIDVERAVETLERMKPEARPRVIGVQAQVWSETIKGARMIEYYLLPKLLGFAETAWAPEREWETIRDATARAAAVDAGWNRLANAIARRELPRLAYFRGGFNYRVPPPGAVMADGRLEANTALPGLDIRYTTDGTTPTLASTRYERPTPVTGTVQLRSFDPTGRPSRTTALSAADGGPAVPVTVAAGGTAPGVPPGTEPVVVPTVDVGRFLQQVRLDVPAPGGAAAVDDVAAAGAVPYAIAGGAVWAWTDGTWRRIDGLPGRPLALAQIDGAVHVRGDRWIARLEPGAPAVVSRLPQGQEAVLLPDGRRLLVLTSDRLLERSGDGWSTRPLPVTRPPSSPSAAAQSADGAVAVIVGGTVFEWAPGQNQWQPLRLQNEEEGWDPPGLRSLAYDTRGRLWVASAQGLAIRDVRPGAGAWRFLDRRNGLPVGGITAVTAGLDGDVWLATRKGAVRLGDDLVEYRQGRRWLPGDELSGVRVSADGTAWFVGAGGVGGIGLRPTTLAGKAAAFEEAIDRFNRRTEYGYVVEANLAAPGDVASATTEDNDNDGLWTSMYGAAECFAYAATGSEAARERARKAFTAVKFLSDVTQGGEFSPPRGFPARSILPIDGFDPNERDNAARDRRGRQRDARWKVFEPRWPRSGCGRWYWKSDTSSDELDGHYFLYGVYHDLVARDEEERREVVEVVRAMTDHLIDHDWTLVDIDGEPTRWAQFAPRQLNRTLDWWEGRGLNSLSILAYLAVAAHVTGDDRYREEARRLIDEHGYATNVLVPKITAGVGGGNQSDDEMAFMNYYHLIRYERDARLRQVWMKSLHDYWQLERPERNPLLNVIAAVCLQGGSFTDPFGTVPLGLDPRDWLEDSIDTLKRFPLDLVDWRLENSHRHDIVRLPRHVRPDVTQPLGLRLDGKVLPVDERMIFHWNHNPYELDTGGGGSRIADGTSYLLPYHMAVFHRVIAP